MLLGDSAKSIVIEGGLLGLLVENRRQCEGVVEELLHLLGASYIQRFACNLVDCGFALGDGFQEFPRNDTPPSTINANTPQHGIENVLRHFHLKGELSQEITLRKTLVENLGTFPSDDTIFTVVCPEFMEIVRHPVIVGQLILPISMVVSIHTGEEIKTLRESGKKGMLG
jgi:hypothetical protein